MIILGITGGSGTGKTTVSNILKNNGVNIIDTDIVARKIVEQGMPALSEIKEYFGNDIVDENGCLLRKKLAKIVFSDNEKLKVLNKITHKYIEAFVNSYISESTSDIVGIDAPALFESGIHSKCNVILSVLANKDLRLKRIVSRDSITIEDAKNRINSQKTDEFYIENSDYIVYNNGDEEDLKSQTIEILDKIRSKF